MASSTQVIDMTRGVYRRIYAGYLTGRRINSVSIQAEAWFWRLMVIADDFGNLHADPDLLKSSAAPLRKCTRPQTKRWTVELVKADLVTSYEVEGEKYLHINDFEDTQTAPRNGRKIRKCPPCVIPGNPRESGGHNTQTHSQAHTHPPQPPRSPKPEHRGVGDALRRLGVSQRVMREFNGVSDDTDTRHWLTLGDAKNPAGALVSRLRNDDTPEKQPTPQAIAEACRAGVIRSVTLDGKTVEVDADAQSIGVNSHGVIIGDSTLSPERIGEAVFA